MQNSFSSFLFIVSKYFRFCCVRVCLCLSICEICFSVYCKKGRSNNKRMFFIDVQVTQFSECRNHELFNILNLDWNGTAFSFSYVLAPKRFLRFLLLMFPSICCLRLVFNLIFPFSYAEYLIWEPTVHSSTFDVEHVPTCIYALW